MTTSNSPAEKLRAQADGIIRMLKKVEKREFPNVPHVAKLGDSTGRLELPTISS